MAQWYYSIKGKAEGPVSDEFLVDGLKSGRLTLVDLVFREGDTAWCTLGEISQFRDVFQALPPPVLRPRSVAVDTESLETTESSDVFDDPEKTLEIERPELGRKEKEWDSFPAWVVLKKREDNNGYEQTGPYSVEQIVASLATGQIHYSQYAWKQGYKRWVRIGNLPEFDRRKRDRDGDPVNQIVPLPSEGSHVPALSREELLESVVRMKPTDRPQLNSEPRPAEAVGEDLVSSAQQATNAQQSSIEAVITPPPIEPLSESPGEPLNQPVNNPSLTPPPLDSSSVLAAQRNSSATKPEANRAKDLAKDSQEPQRKKAERQPASGFRQMLRLFLAGAAVGLAVVGTIKHAPEIKSTLFGSAQSDAPSDPAEAGQAPSSPKRPGAVGQKPRPANPTMPEAASPGAETTDNQAMESNGGVASIPGASGAASEGEPNRLDEKMEAGAAEMSQRALPNVPLQGQERSKSALAGKGSKETEAPHQAPARPDIPASIRPVAPGTGKVTVLDVVPLKLTTQPLLVVQTNAAIGERISVGLKARSGEILRWPSYRRTINFQRVQGEIPVVDLAKLDLPRGKYQVEIKAGEMQKDTTIFIGAKDQSFATDLEAHLKSIATQQQTEKKTLFYSARTYEGLAKSLGDNYEKLREEPSKWKSFYSAWLKNARSAGAPVAQLLKARSSSLAFPDELKEFREKADALLNQARQLDQAVAQKREVAAARPLPIVREFSRIKTEAGQLTVRR